MACDAHTHEISGRGHNDLPVCPMKDFRPWSHMFTRTTDGKYFENLLPVRPEKVKRKTRMAIAKPSALQANAKTRMVIAKLLGLDINAKSLQIKYR